MRETKSFNLIPLSPVHVGTGQTIAPETYYQDEQQLVRVNLSSLLRSLPSEDREKIEGALDRNDLKYARSIIQARARDPRFHLYRVTVGSSSRQDLSNLLRDPDRPRSGEIHLLPRNPYSGAPYLPGSSIKGAMRTALLNVAVHEQSPEKKATVTREVLDTYSNDQPSRQSPQLLEELAFARLNRDTHWDPLRALFVSDVNFDSSDARIDRVRVRYRSGDDLEVNQQASNIQMHFERLASQADGGTVPAGLVTITIDKGILRVLKEKYNRKLWPMLPDSMDPWVLLQYACNSFYKGRLETEWNEFPYVREQARPEGTWAVSSWEKTILLRVGRFSHFDSLSVNELRRGFNAQTRQPIFGLGATRTLCELADGKRMAPMGWVMLRESDVG